MPQINHKFFSLHFGNAIVTNQLPQFFFLNSSPRFRQVGCHNSFFFFPLPFSATWLPQFIFSLSSLPYNFGNLVATIGFPLGTPPSASTSGTSHSLGQYFWAARISIISLSKFNFFSLPITSLSLILFLTISATVSPKFTLFPYFPK